MPVTLKKVTIPVTPAVPIPEEVVPTPLRARTFDEIPTLYDPSILDDVVDKPEIVKVSLLLKLCGLSEKITYSPFLLEGVISTPVMELVATLTLLTDLPAK